MGSAQKRQRIVMDDKKNSFETSRLQTATSSIQKRRIAYGTESRQFGDLYTPIEQELVNPFPLVVVIHGGAWLSQYTLDGTSALCEAFAKAGIASWNLEYRCIGDSGGGYPGTFLDICAGVDFVEELNRYIDAAQTLDLQKVVLIGHSAGGHLAVWAGSRSHIPAGHPLATGNRQAIKGVISLAGVLDLQEAAANELGGNIVHQLLNTSSPDSLYPATSPQAMLPADVPVVLFHGNVDTEVPLSMSESYLRKAQQKGGHVDLVPLENADHFVLTHPSGAIWETLLDATKNLIDA